MYERILITIISLIFFTNAYPQSGKRSFISDSLTAYVEKALDIWKIPGAAVCIVKDGKVVVMNGYGVREVGTETDVDENTLFMIGSNTKAFTGTALAMLEHEGKISLDDKVQKYLPDFSMKDPWVAKELNLTDIVSHRIGMETFQGDFMYWTSDLTIEEVIEKFGMLTPFYDFRAKWGYTNAGYAIAGKIIEKISGKSWGEFLNERIFTPLGMENTLAYSRELINSDNYAKPHTIIDNEIVTIPIPNIDNLAPAGSISSSVNDMSKWMLLQLNNGKLNSEETIPESVFKKTRQPASVVRRITHPFNTQHYSLYALGWQLEDYEGKELVQHTGGVNGFVTSVTLIPEENLGIVVLTNTDQNAFYVALKWEIIDAYFGLPFRNYSDLFFERSKAGREKEEKRIEELRDSVKTDLAPSLPLDNYTGRYFNEIYGFIDIEQTGNDLTMNFEHHSNLQGKLESLGENRFLCTYSDPIYGIKVIPFEMKDNEIISFTLSVHPFIEFTTYEFIKNNE